VRPRRGARLCLALGGLLALAPAGARAAVGQPATIDGPSAAIVALDGVAVAPDGSGALVYRKVVGDGAHVFVSVEGAGAWAAPVQLDTGIEAAATAAAVAVASGGRVAVTWVAGGTLYGAVRASAAAAFSPPQAIASATGVPALGMGVSGTTYVAYASPDAGGSDIDVARLDRLATTFVPLAAPLTPSPAVLAQAGGGPVITVAADATAVVAWAAQEADGSTHVWVRRASGAGPSPVLDDATVPSLDGLAGGSADSPALGVQYDSSVAWLAFGETFGGFSRLVVDELLGDELRPPAFADSLGSTAGPSSAQAPSLAVNGDGGGLLAGETAPANQVVAAQITASANPYAWNAGALLTPAAAALAPQPLAVLSVSGYGAVVYVPAAGALDAAPFYAGKAAGQPLVLSTAALGPVVAADGFSASADDRGDLVVGFVAGASAALSVAAQPIVVAPGAPRATGTQLWTAVRRPTLRWQAAADSWLPPTYSVYLDGARVATTSSRSYTPPGDLPDGRHSWKVIATDSLGQTATSQTRRLLIDAAPPTIRLLVDGSRTAGTALAFHVEAAAISGVRRVSLSYGDGSVTSAPDSTHVYAKPGHYTVTTTVLDRAGVEAVARETVTAG
jgi:PKD domain